MKFRIISRTREKYMMIQLGSLMFLDSFKFNDASLEKIIDSHRKTKPSLAKAFPRFMEHHPWMEGIPENEVEHALNLLLRKIPMPYSSMTGPEYFELPALLHRNKYSNDMGVMQVIADGNPGEKMYDEICDNSYRAVSYTHLTLPTIYSV